MHIPRLALPGAGAAVAVHVVRRVLSSTCSAKSRSCRRSRAAPTPEPSFSDSLQPSSLSPDSGMSPGGSSSRAAPNNHWPRGLVVLLSTLPLLAATGVAGLREKWDRAGAVAVAWLLVPLSQVGLQFNRSSRAKSVLHLLPYDSCIGHLACSIAVM